MLAVNSIPGIVTSYTEKVLAAGVFFRSNMPQRSDYEALSNVQLQDLMVKYRIPCPIPIPDLEWAFSGLPVSGANKQTPADTPAILVQIAPPDMIDHYGFDRPARKWRTVTPVILPEPVPFTRRGSQRAESEGRSAYALAQACRHAGISARPTDIRVQEEPFMVRGEMAGAYSAGPGGLGQSTRRPVGFAARRAFQRWTVRTPRFKKVAISFQPLSVWLPMQNRLGQDLTEFMLVIVCHTDTHGILRSAMSRLPGDAPYPLFSSCANSE
jgi:hypothetical protein